MDTAVHVTLRCRCCLSLMTAVGHCALPSMLGDAGCGSSSLNVHPTTGSLFLVMASHGGVLLWIRKGLLGQQLQDILQGEWFGVS